MEGEGYLKTKMSDVVTKRRLFSTTCECPVGQEPLLHAVSLDLIKSHLRIGTFGPKLVTIVNN